MPPLDLYLSSRVAVYTKKAHDSGMDDLIRKKCNRRYGALGGALTNRRLDTPCEKGLDEWVGSEQEDGEINHNAKKVLKPEGEMGEQVEGRHAQRI